MVDITSTEDAKISTLESRRLPNYTYKLKIELGFMQISTNLTFILDIPWPSYYDKFLDFFDVVNLDFIPWQSVGCVAKFGFYDRYWLLTITRNFFSTCDRSDRNRILLYVCSLSFFEIAPKLGLNRPNGGFGPIPWVISSSPKYRQHKLAKNCHPQIEIFSFFYPVAYMYSLAECCLLYVSDVPSLLHCFHIPDGNKALNSPQNDRPLKSYQTTDP
jgi:hypothetical protein